MGDWRAQGKSQAEAFALKQTYARRRETMFRLLAADQSLYLRNVL
jgi:uncharacterized protein HemX